MNEAKAATFVAKDAAPLRYVEKSNPRTSGFQFLTYGVYELEGPVRSAPLVHPEEESLLFCLRGEAAQVAVGGRQYALSRYDVPYVPRAPPTSCAGRRPDDAGGLPRPAGQCIRPFTPAGPSSPATGASSAV